MNWMLSFIHTDHCHMSAHSHICSRKCYRNVPILWHYRNAVWLDVCHCYTLPKLSQLLVTFSFHIHFHASVTSYFVFHTSLFSVLFHCCQHLLFLGIYLLIFFFVSFVFLTWPGVRTLRSTVSTLHWGSAHSLPASTFVSALWAITL